MCGSDINYQPPAQIDYGDSMRDGLQAQVDLAPDLYAAESDQDYGRPAYARMNQEIMEETLLGKKETYDSEGRLVTGFDTQDGVAPQDFKIKLQNKYEGYERSLTIDEKKGGNFYQVIDAKTGNVVSESPHFSMTIDEGRQRMWRETGARNQNDTQVQAWMKGHREKHIEAFFKQPELADIGFGEEEAATVLNAKHLDALELRTDGTITEQTPIYAKDADGNVIQDKSKAGQTTYAGGGMVENIAGDQEQEFVDSDGTKSTRKAGFNKDGTFAGVSALARDLQQLDTAQRFSGELKAIEENADKFTDAYRKQGDLKGALAEVKTLSQKSAIPKTKLEDKGNALSNLANSFSTPQISSPYGRTQGTQPQVNQSVPFDASQRVSMDQGQLDQAGFESAMDAKQNYDPQADQDSIFEKYNQHIRDIQNGETYITEEQAQQQFDQEMSDFNARQAGSPSMTTGQTQVAEANAVGRRTKYVATGDKESPEYQGGGMSVAQQGAANMMSAGRAGGMMSGIGGTVQAPAPPPLDENGYPLDGIQLEEDGQYSFKQNGQIISKGDSPESAMANAGNQPQAQMSQGGGQLTDARGVDRVSIGRGTTAVDANDITSNEDVIARSVDTIPKVAGGVSTNANFGDISARDTTTDLNLLGDVRGVDSQGLGNMQGLRSAMGQQAVAELNLGGDLSARDRRLAQQDARAASTARGRSRDTSSILSELENNERMRSTRKNERRAFAGQVLGMEGQFAGQEASMDMQAQMSNQASDQRLNDQLLQQGQLALQQDTGNRARNLQADMANQSSAQAEFGANQQGQNLNQNFLLSQNQLSTQAQMANQNADIQTGVANQGADMQRQLANQQAGLTAGQANQGAMLTLGAREMAASAQDQTTQMGLTQMEQSALAANAQAERDRQARLLDAGKADIDRGIQVGQINQSFDVAGLAADRAAVAQRVGLEQATVIDPTQALFGRASGAGTIGGQNLYGNAATTGQLPTMYNPAQGAQFAANQAAGLNSYNAAYMGAQGQVSAGKSAMVGNMVSGLFQGIGNAVPSPK